MSRALLPGVVGVLLVAAPWSGLAGQEPEPAAPTVAADAPASLADQGEVAGSPVPVLVEPISSVLEVRPGPGGADPAPTARAGFAWLPTLAQGMASWLRADLPRHRRILVYELTAGRGGMAARLPGGPLLPTLLLASALAGAVVLLRRRAAFRTAPSRSASVTSPTPRPMTRSEQARRLLDGGVQQVDAARETGLAREGLELMVRLAGGTGRPEEADGRPWARPSGGPVGETTRAPARVQAPAGPGPFHVRTTRLEAAGPVTYGRPR